MVSALRKLSLASSPVTPIDSKATARPNTQKISFVKPAPLHLPPLRKPDFSLNFFSRITSVISRLFKRVMDFFFGKPPKKSFNDLPNEIVKEMGSFLSKAPQFNLQCLDSSRYNYLKKTHTDVMNLSKYRGLEDFPSIDLFIQKHHATLEKIIFPEHFPKAKKLEIIKKCPHLKDIDLSRYIFRSLSERDIISIIKAHPHLEELIIPQNQNISEKTLEALAESTPNLRYLILASCKNISSQGFQNYLSKLKKLEKLDLTDCENVNDQALSNIAKNCTSLQQLKLSNCIEVSDNNIEELASFCKNLTLLYIDGCQIFPIYLLAFSQEKHKN